MTERGSRSTKHLPLFEAPDEAKLRTWVQLIRTFMRMQRRVVLALAGQDVTLPQFDVLATLRFSEGVTQQELAERLLVTKGNVCGVLDRLEIAGWVQRQADPSDGRANRLYLTQSGRAKINVLLPAHDAIVIESMRILSSSEVKTLRRLLEELESGLDAA